jgi:nucleotide-binding universal stress UspA family protein
MSKNDIWIVALDFTDMDESILRNTAFYADLLKPEKIYFANVQKEMESVSHLPEEYLSIRDQVNQDRELQLKSKVERFFKAGIPSECLILTGSVFDEIMGLVARKFASLVIAGRKKESDGAGIVSERLSQGLACNFLLIPESFDARLKNVLVATDFSEHSKLAMNHALQLQKASEDVRIFTHHIYEIPIGYSKSGKSLEEFTEIMRVNAETQMDRWLKDFPKNIVHEVVLRDKKSVPSQILKIAENYQIDLIVMGSKGLSKSAFMLLGSNTIKLMKVNEQIPMMIVKKENENLKFLDAIKKL